jgi:ABC-type lipoprotein release transport system permease subunit
MSSLWAIALRDLGRNRRRTISTLAAVALGLALIIMLSGFIAGVLEDSIQTSIRMQTGHLQLRANSYEQEKLSLLSRDLVGDVDTLVAQVRAREGVVAVAPVLWAGAVLGTLQETSGLQVTGIDPSSPFHDPIRQGLIAGEFLMSDDRGEILVGRRLAEEMGIGVGQRVSLALGNANGQPQEGVFTVKGLFDTGFPGYDENTVFMPLDQAQSFTGAGNRASAVIILLQERADAAAVAGSLQQPGIIARTWEQLNTVILQSMQTALAFYYILYGIVILVVAVIIANTLLMTVFERTRELGILAALGMKGRQIMLMVLMEAGILALIGIAFGILLGSAIVFFLSVVGIPIGESAASVAQGFVIGTKMYARYVPGDIITLSIAMLVIVLLAALYPARYAARLEPVAALRAL